MRYLLDILQAAGIGSATGIRPFLPALAAGALARADVGVDFEGTAFAFLESPIFLIALIVAMAAMLVVALAIPEAFERYGLLFAGGLSCSCRRDGSHVTIRISAVFL